MNFPISRDVADLNLHILLKCVGPEQFVASVAELHDCQVTARETPWTEFIGMYEGDADFAEIMAEMRAERGLKPHSSIGL
jgi:predicted RNA polymerase sigma factor